MYHAVLGTIRSAGPLTLDELFDDLRRQRWIGEQHDPPIEVAVPSTKCALSEELHDLGRQGLIRLGPNGWEAVYVPFKLKASPQKSLF